MKKLISTLALTCRHCQSMRMTGEAKPSEAEATESELSMSVIPFNENKKEETILVLSSLWQNLLFAVKRIKISCDGERVAQEEVEEKDVSKGMIPVNDT